MPPRDLQKFSDLVRRLREQSGMTMRELSEGSGLQRTLIYRFENGEIASPKPEHLQRLARTLKVDVEEFYSSLGYPTVMPELQTYLRRKYGLTNEAASRVEGYVEAIVQSTTTTQEEGPDDHTGDKAT